MAFEITANNLERNSEIKTLKLQSEEYAVTIFYYGDYKADMKAGRGLVSNLSMRCKAKGEGFPLVCMSGMVLLEVPAHIVNVREIEGLKNSLDVAGKAAIELQEILQKYFNIIPQ
ncbi:MAG: hypothetical protein J6A94_07310 [Lachnospiraceae bacterium]|nr:hypothetical protein [Lachnospiraceae bacterium]